MRDDNEYAGYVQWVVSNMHLDPKFKTLFGGATENKYLSPHTIELRKYNGEGVADYIGPLKEMLDAFAATAEDAGEDAQQRAANVAAIQSDAVRFCGTVHTACRLSAGLVLILDAPLVHCYCFRDLSHNWMDSSLDAVPTLTSLLCCNMAM